MVATAKTVRFLPEAANEIPISLDKLRKFLSRHPELDAALPRCGRNRLIGDAELEMIRRALAAGK